MKLLGLLFISILLQPYSLRAQSDFRNLDEYFNRGQYFQCEEFNVKKRLKVAIIDTSFGDDLEEKRGKSLPADFELLLAKNGSVNLTGFHGAYTAEILHAFMSKNDDCPENSAKIYLIPNSGFAQFTQAVDTAIAKDVDIILYSSVYHYLGNGDGSGFINRLVDKAIDSGITWINAVGNFQGAVYQAEIEKSYDSKFLDINSGDDKIYFSCDESNCELASHLTWNSFQEDANTGTDKDLDYMVLECNPWEARRCDSEANLVWQNYLYYRNNICSADTCTFATYLEWDGRLKNLDRVIDIAYREQMINKAKANAKGISKASIYPFESISVNKNSPRRLNKGKTYAIKVFAKDIDQWSSYDFLRISLEGEGIKLLSQNPNMRANTVFPPADNDRVISIGASDSSKSSIAAAINKPNIITESKVFITPSKGFDASSVAVSFYTAQFALVKGIFPEEDEDSIREKVMERFYGSRCNYPLDLEDKLPEVYSLGEYADDVLAMPGPDYTTIVVDPSLYSDLEVYKKWDDRVLLYSKKRGFYSKSGASRLRSLSSDEYFINDDTYVDYNFCEE